MSGFNEAPACPPGKSFADFEAAREWMRLQ